MDNIFVYKIVYLITAIGAGLIVFYMLSVKKWTKFNFLYALLNMSLLIWAMGRFQLLVVEDYSNAMLWARILNIGSILVHIFFLHAILVFTKREKHRTIPLVLFYCNAFFLLFLNFIDIFLNTNFFLYGLGPKLSFLWVEIPRGFYHLHLLNEILIPTWAFAEMLFAYRKAFGVFKYQIKFLIVSSMFGFIGGNSVIFLIYDIEFYPFLVFFVPINLFTMAYAILRYRLMDTRVVVRSGMIIFFTLLVLLLLFGSSILFLSSLAAYEMSFSLFLGIISFFVLSLILFTPIKEGLSYFFNRFFFSSLYNEEVILRDLIKRIPRVLNLNELVDVIVSTTKKVLQVDNLGLWSINISNNEYITLQKIGSNDSELKDVVKNKGLIKYFQAYNKSLMYREIDIVLNDPFLVDDYKDFEKLRAKMMALELESIVPLIVKNEIVGMIFLGKKIDEASYSSRDIRMIEGIADQSAIALQNASLYKETQEFGERMEKEVQKATSKLRRVNKQLMKLDKAKSEFISIASHQLRTPLTAIKGYASMVLEGDYGNVNKQLQPAIDRIYSSSNRMTSLVENLLNVSRIESGKIVFLFKELDFQEITSNIVKDFGSIVKRKGLKLTFICPKKIPLINADEVKIKEVVSNLIDNAIKYTEKGKIDVKLETVNHGKKFILLSVTDTGMGIEDDDLPNVFEKFRRGKKVALVHTEGLGLGMYFSQKIVEAHKGKIWVESKGIDKGSTFYVKLPL